MVLSLSVAFYVFDVTEMLYTMETEIDNWRFHEQKHYIDFELDLFNGDNNVVILLFVIIVT